MRWGSRLKLEIPIGSSTGSAGLYYIINEKNKTSNLYVLLTIIRKNRSTLCYHNDQTMRMKAVAVSKQNFSYNW